MNLEERGKVKEMTNGIVANHLESQGFSLELNPENQESSQKESLLSKEIDQVEHQIKQLETKVISKRRMNLQYKSVFRFFYKKLFRLDNQIFKSSYTDLKSKNKILRKVEKELQQVIKKYNTTLLHFLEPKEVLCTKKITF